MGAAVSLDGFIADDSDEVGPLFDWYGNGDVAWSFPGTDREFRPPKPRPTSCRATTATWRRWSSDGVCST